MENQEQTQEVEFIKVDKRFLQEILNYLSTKPYNEVHQFVDVLVGRQNFQQQPQPQQPEQVNTTQEVEGFSTEQSNQEV
jgi:hypothetical protein